MSANLKTTDRLAARGKADSSGFFFFAAVGGGSIIAAKAFGVAGNWVAVGAVAMMFLYAALLRRRGPNRLRADQAGDNCYYLGLVYTLASLAYAIATFDPDDTASGIVQGFGVALGTTIVGLVLRVFFNQGRPDLENVEEQSRLEMTDAVSRLKAQLGDCVRQFNDFSREMQQSMAELHDATSKSITQLTADATEGLKKVVDEASSTIREEANDFAGRSRRYESSFNRLLQKLEEHTDGVEELIKAQNGMRKMADTASKAAAAAASSAGSFHKVAEESRMASEAARGATEQLHVVASGLEKSVVAIQATLTAMQKQADRQMEALRGGPGSAMFEIGNVLNRAAEELRSHVAATGKLQAETHAGMTAQAEVALKTTRQLNERLQHELERSTQLVTKVHGALVDMTGRLAESVEGAAR